jgi:hypothetical protein
MVEPLVQEMARFLAVRHVHQKADPVLRDAEPRGELLPHGAFHLVQSLLLPNGHVVALIDATRPQHFVQGLNDLGLKRSMPNAKRLQHEHIVEFVHHQRGQTIGFTENYAATFRLAHAHAIVPSSLDLAPEERTIDRLIEIFGEHPHADLALRIEVALTERAFFHIEYLNDAAGL